MVGKRRQEELEDSEDDIQTLSGEDERGTPLKRARTEEPENEDEEEDNADIRLNVDETITDAELERMHEAAINEKLSQKAGKAGVSIDVLRRPLNALSEISPIIFQAVAELGIIQQVDLINFLCHRNLTVKLIPQINFITGASSPSVASCFGALVHCADPACPCRSQWKLACFGGLNRMTSISVVRLT